MEAALAGRVWLDRKDHINDLAPGSVLPDCQLQPTPLGPQFPHMQSDTGIVQARVLALPFLSGVNVVTAELGLDLLHDEAWCRG